MAKTTYKLELDCFSGRPNPKFEIAKEDFAVLYSEIQRLETITPQPLFDGLGFRGFVLSDSFATLISVQQHIIKIAINKSAQYKKNNRAILTRLISLAGKYDEEKAYETLIKKITEEYLL